MQFLLKPVFRQSVARQRISVLCRIHKLNTLGLLVKSYCILKMGHVNDQLVWS